ncbi:hypothetical protein [Mesorhizobium sp.]|nr:hypothetical protein [Mesorhizobium sp.]
MQHETRPMFGPPIGDAITAFAASQQFWCGVAKRIALFVALQKP